MTTPETSLTPADAAAFRDRLERRADELRAEVRALDPEQSEPVAGPRDEVDDALADGEIRTRSALRHAEQERDIIELQAIDAALARIAAGTYGQCIDCDVAIPRARLEAEPSAARCIECQQRWEASHPAVPRAAPLG